MKRFIKQSLLLAVIGLSAVGCGSKTQPVDSSAVAIVPEPLEISMQDQGVEITSFRCATSDTSLCAMVDFMNQKMEMPEDGMGETIRVSIDTTMEAEAYEIVTEKSGVSLRSGSITGAQYGMITVTQMMSENHILPLGRVYDKPRFAWRGFMLDVSRHFQPKEKVMELLDLMAYHKLNKFHWHLTDGIGWRIKIDAYPELTNRGAWRTIVREDAPWVGMKLSHEGAENTYGGYYTKDDIREVVAYATARGIEVIPEIEMPGHSEAATQCYPQYSCSNARPGSGVYCASSDSTLHFLTTILDEVAELFPSQYIHIGGDEVGKGQWAECPECQALKKAKGLKDEHELQSYFVSRVNDHVNSIGKKLIGWDEITEGGLAESATVMSWTGYENGIKAAEHGNYVVMCPLDYVYFDHYQGYNNFEPQAWGGLNDLKRVYDFSVIPAELGSQFHKYVMGGQANLWTENISTWEHVLYMTLPRMAALSETLWSDPARKDWDRFADKTLVMLDRYEKNGYNYSESAFTPRVGETSLADGSVSVTLTTELPSIIRYTTDGSEPTATSSDFDSLITVDKMTTIKARAFDHSGRERGEILTIADLDNLASGKKVTYQTPFNGQYNGGGETALVDGRYAVKRGDDKTWQGFEKKDAIVTIDLGEAQQINLVGANFFQHIGSTSVMLPVSVEVSTSNDGVHFKSQKTVKPAANGQFDAFVERVDIPLPQSVSARYVRLKAKNMGTLPRNIHHPRGGDTAWVFMDEIIVK